MWGGGGGGHQSIARCPTGWTPLARPGRKLTTQRQARPASAEAAADLSSGSDFAWCLCHQVLMFMYRGVYVQRYVTDLNH